MESAKEYGFEDDYEGHQDFDAETAKGGKGQPKPKLTFKEEKKQIEAW